MTRLYDLTPGLHSRVAVWPGDTRFSLAQGLRLEQGDPVNLGSITLSLHTGAHADAPWHYDPKGSPIDEVPLEPFIGTAHVVTVDCPGPAITEAALGDALRDIPSRLLVKTGSNPDADTFPESFIYFAPEAAAAVGRAGVVLIGTDAPSVDPLDSKTLPAHNAFGRAGVSILENLYLDQVPDGRYELIALPLKIVGGDGAPVRAVLRELS